MIDEPALIAQALRGDTNAYASLVQPYEQIAFRAAYLITHDEHEAADAAQDAFLRAYRALRSFKTHQPFRPWLLRIVTNQALNRVKSAQRRNQMAERYQQEMDTQQATESPDHAVVAHEQSEQMLEAVRHLNDDDQALITLRYFLELPEREVAQALNIPVGTVKSRLHRTLARLRELIEREFPDLGPVIGSQ